MSRALFPIFQAGPAKTAGELPLYRDVAWDRFSIFTWDYGCELETLAGQPYRRDTRLSEAVRYAREALEVYPYIRSATVEEVGFEGSTLTLRVTIQTVYGEVNINV